MTLADLQLADVREWLDHILDTEPHADDGCAACEGFNYRLHMRALTLGVHRD